MKIFRVLSALFLSCYIGTVYAENSFTLPKIGVAFGDVDRSYTVQDIKQAMRLIQINFPLVRVYDDFGGGRKYQALMQSADAYSVDVILGVENVQLLNYLGTIEDAKNYLNAHAYYYDTAGVRHSWRHLKVIMVGNETEGVNGTVRHMYYLSLCVQNLINALNSGEYDDIKDQIAVSIDFGQALHETSDPRQCDFTGLQGDQNPVYIESAMKAIMNNSNKNSPKMVFGNLYPFFAPERAASLATPEKMIEQFAGTGSGWNPYTCALNALKNAGLETLELNVGETGWATRGNDAGRLDAQLTSISRSNIYLHAFTRYLQHPESYYHVNKFAGRTTIFFEMFDEPMKKDYPFESAWGLYNAIQPDGDYPVIKSGIEIPFNRTMG